MMTYRLAPRGVIRLSDDLPITSDMIEWEDYRQWLKSGGTPEPMPVIPPVPPTTEEITARLTLVVQAHLDATAKTRGYDSILSACSYATDTNPPFALEAQACVEFRSAVWLACYSIMADVLNGIRPIPTGEELIAELPAIVWPT